MVRGRNGVRREIYLNEKQQRAMNFIRGLRRGERIWSRMTKSDAFLVKEWHGQILLPPVLEAVEELRDIPGLPSTLPSLGGKGWWSIGAAHELIRLAWLDFSTETLAAIGKQVPVAGQHGGQQLDGTLEIDGLTSAGVGIEIKLATDGFSYLAENGRCQAAKYGLAVKRGWLKEVQYHLTTPKVDQAAVESLREVIPALRIFQYNGLFLPNGEINVQTNAVY